MEERKTAAIVLGILAVIVIGFLVISPIVKRNQTHTISFRNCIIKFNYSDNEELNKEIEEAQKNKLALCLCDSYQNQPNIAVRNRIIELYQESGNHYGNDSLRLSRDLDSLLKHKETLFDTLVIWE